MQTRELAPVSRVSKDDGRDEKVWPTGDELVRTWVGHLLDVVLALEGVGNENNQVHVRAVRRQAGRSRASSLRKGLSWTRCLGRRWDLRERRCVGPLYQQ